MSNDAMESGWKRFLRRLKRFWGTSPRDNPATAAPARVPADEGRSGTQPLT